MLSTTARWKTRSLVAGLGMLALVAAAPSAHEQTPTGAEIVARHVKAIGGAEAYKKIQSVKIEGRFEIVAQNVGGTMTVFQARPNRMLVRVEIPGVGTIMRGYDGKHGWSIDPLAGASLQAGRELTETQDEAWFDGPLYEAGQVKSFGPVTKLDFDGRPAYQVKITLQSGTESTDYFDAEHGYQIGSESSRIAACCCAMICSFAERYASPRWLMTMSIIRFMPSLTTFARSTSLRTRSNRRRRISSR